MRPNTPKRAAHNRRCKAERDAYREQFAICQVCCKRLGQAVHEIARGVHRKAALAERCTYLVVCEPCHTELDNYSKWPLTKQLAAKLLRDSDGFNLERFNEIRGRDKNAITLAEVVRHLELT